MISYYTTPFYSTALLNFLLDWIQKLSLVNETSDSSTDYRPLWIIETIGWRIFYNNTYTFDAS